MKDFKQEEAGRQRFWEEEAGLWEGLAGNFFEKQAAFSHLFTDSSLSPKGLPTYASDVAPDLLGVQFDGKNFSVV